MLKTTCEVTTVLIVMARIQVLLLRLTVQNVSAQQFTPPTHRFVSIYLLEYLLNQNTGGYATNPPVFCGSGDTDHGCSAIPSMAYPYTTNPVTV